MLWQQWVLVGYLVLAAAGYVAKTGRDREPITRYEAAGTVVEVALLIWLVLSI